MPATLLNTPSHTCLLRTICTSRCHTTSATLFTMPAYCRTSFWLLSCSGPAAPGSTMPAVAPRHHVGQLAEHSLAHQPVRDQLHPSPPWRPPAFVHLAAVLDRAIHDEVVREIIASVSYACIDTLATTLWPASLDTAHSVALPDASTLTPPYPPPCLCPPPQARPWKPLEYSERKRPRESQPGGSRQSSAAPCGDALPSSTASRINYPNSR